MSLFRVDYQGRGELSERQQKIGHLLSRLHKLAVEYNVAVVITNQVMADPGGSIFAGADNKKARAVCSARAAAPGCCAWVADATAACAARAAHRRPRAGARLHHAPVSQEGCVIHRGRLRHDASVASR